MYIVLLTGGLASGKDTVAAIMAELGATVLDLDRIAKEEQEDELVLAQLMEEFGEDIVDPSGSLDRRLLARRAFADEESVGKLNAICWPPVKERLDSYILNNTDEGRGAEKLLVIQIPLLVEAPDFLYLKDEVISVVADEGLRLERAIARGMSPEDARSRLALQAGDEERVAISDTVFTNNGTREELKAQILSWYNDRIAGRLF